jgi:hypothetical protein
MEHSGEPVARARAGARGVSFVIRLWLEAPGRAGRPEWRWYVRHVQSPRDRHGRRWRELLAFIGEQAGVAPPGVEGEDGVLAPAPAARPEE